MSYQYYPIGYWPDYYFPPGYFYVSGESFSISLEPVVWNWEATELIFKEGFAFVIESIIWNWEVTDLTFQYIEKQVAVGPVIAVKKRAIEIPYDIFYEITKGSIPEFIVHKPTVSKTQFKIEPVKRQFTYDILLADISFIWKTGNIFFSSVNRYQRIEDDDFLLLLDAA